MIPRDVVYWNKNTNGVSRSCAGRCLLLSLFFRFVLFLWLQAVVPQGCVLGAFLFSKYTHLFFRPCRLWNPQATRHLYLNDYNIFTCSNLSFNFYSKLAPLQFLHFQLMTPPFFQLLKPQKPDSQQYKIEKPGLHITFLFCSERRSR